MIERSELWVYKKGKDEDSDKSSGNSHENFVLINQILETLADLCRQLDTSQREHYQLLLKNLDAHEEVMTLFKIPCDRKDPLVIAMEARAHDVLQEFCRGNKDNQFALHKHADFFADQLKSSKGAIETLIQIYLDNVDLCRHISAKTIQQVLSAIDAENRRVAYIRFLKTVVKPENEILHHAQNMIMDSFTTVSEDVLLFYNDEVSFTELLVQMTNDETFTQESNDLLYHLELVSLLALCTAGMNVYTEIKCQVSQ